jgi:hypothetical protein
VNITARQPGVKRIFKRKGPAFHRAFHCQWQAVERIMNSTLTPVNTKSSAVLKIAFANNTAGTNLGLFAGRDAEFTSGTGGTQLSDSRGPGFQVLTITDTRALEGQIIFVRRIVGSADSSFTLNVE